MATALPRAITLEAWMMISKWLKDLPDCPTCFQGGSGNFDLAELGRKLPGEGALHRSQELLDGPFEGDRAIEKVVATIQNQLAVKDVFTAYRDKPWNDTFCQVIQARYKKKRASDPDYKLPLRGNAFKFKTIAEFLLKDPIWNQALNHYNTSVQAAVRVATDVFDLSTKAEMKWLRELAFERLRRLLHVADPTCLRQIIYSLFHPAAPVDGFGIQPKALRSYIREYLEGRRTEFWMMGQIDDYDNMIAAIDNTRRCN